ncbi:hypothetical protein Sjap_013794 [Stephania japonica]|uniref:Uncharacterized protein n=1 Tax=Stephania japonica TaxID=461633 RepID=A0AAP0NY07_9MAGN
MSRTLNLICLWQMMPHPNLVQMFLARGVLPLDDESIFFKWAFASSCSAREEMSRADTSCTRLVGGWDGTVLRCGGDCPKGRVYSLGSLESRKRIYDDLGASTSQEPMVPRFDNIADQLRLVVAFM